MVVFIMHAGTQLFKVLTGNKNNVFNGEKKYKRIKMFSRSFANSISNIVFDELNAKINLSRVGK